MSYRIIFKLIIISLVYLWGFIPQKIYAAEIQITSSPDTIIVGQQSSISFTGTFDPDSTYNIKVRVEQNSSFSMGQTYNGDNNTWLNDTNTWSSFPSFETTSDGKMQTDPTTISFRLQDTATATTNNLTIRVRKSDTSNNEDSNTVTFTSIANTTPSPTPTPTPAPTPSSTPKPEINNISITELYPSTNSGEEEWVEFYNANNEKINLKGWYLKDKTDNKKYLPDFPIEASSHAYFSFSTGYLNNDGDMIRLYDENNNEKSSIPAEYSSVENGYSWAGTSGVWCISEPTKGAGNIGCLETSPLPTPTPSTSPSPTPKTSATIAKEKTTTDSKKVAKIEEAETNYDRKQPNLGVQNTEEDKNQDGQVAGATTQIKPPKPNLTLPLSITGAGFLLLGGVSFPYVKPKLLTIVNKIRKR